MSTTTVQITTAQARTELRLLARNGEQLLLTLGIPVLLLVFFSLVDVLPTGSGKAVDFLAPGILALAVMSTSMVGLGIATGFERKYGVLKRLGCTPLTRGGLLAAKITSLLVVELAQVVVLAPVALALGWHLHASGAIAGVAAALLGTVAFAGIGLVLAGRLRGEINLAAVNGLYLVLLLVSGMVITLDKLPAPMRAVARGLPSGALADALRGALTGAGVPGRAWVVLAVWAVITPVLAARLFRWE